MNLRIVAVGKVKEKYLQQGLNDYLSRIKPYARVELIELVEARESGRGELARQDAMGKEAETISRHLREDAFRITLSEEGEAMTSIEFARRLESLSIEGKSKLDFIIGSHLGLDPALKRTAHLLLSLSSMTLPHLLARLILLEQIYRSFKIIRGEPYHR